MESRGIVRRFVALSRSRSHSVQANARPGIAASFLVMFLLMLPGLLLPAVAVAADAAEKVAPAESRTGSPGIGYTGAEGAPVQRPADETAKKDHQLDPIVVTATRTEKSIADVPAATSVVTREDIESRNIQKVDEAMNLVPGLFDKRAKGLDTTGRVTLRGLPDQKRTLVLLDGQPLNNGYTGHVDWNSINPEDVQQIEVARGPFSSLYGGNAMGGVVNIITRMPEKREVTVKGGYGSENYWSTYGSYGDKLFDRLRLLASFGYKSSDGYPSGLVVKKPSGSGGTPARGAVPTTDSYGAPAFIIGDTGDNSWWTQSGGLKLSYDVCEDAKVFFSYRNNQYGYGYDNPNSYLANALGDAIWSGPVNFRGNTLSFTEGSFLSGGGSILQNLYNGGLETRLFGDSVLKISGGLIDMPTNWYVTPSSSTATRSGGIGTISETPTRAYHADAQLSIPVLEKHMLIVGTAFRHDEANNQEHALTDWTDTGSKADLTYEAKGVDNIFSFYSQAEIALFRDVTLYAGLRGDYWETFDGMANQVGVAGYPQYYDSKGEFSVNPKGSVVYKPLDGTTFRASIGTAFRPPNVYELYRTWVTSYGTVYQGNPELDPENSFSWDIGVEQKIGRSTVLKLTYFNNTIDDFIYFRTVTPTLLVQTNAGKAETDGFELEAETRPWECLKLFTSFTYTHSEMLDNPANPLTEGKQLPGVPRYMFSAGGEVKYRRLSFTAIGRYVSKQYSSDQNLDTVSGVYGSYDAYFVGEFAARYKLTDWATIDFAVNNIFDNSYYSYYKAPGRQFFGGVTARF